MGSEDLLLLNALSLSLDELVKRINERGGAAVPAHINRGNNGLLNVLGFLPPGLEIAAVEVTREWKFGAIFLARWTFQAYGFCTPATRTIWKTCLSAKFPTKWRKKAWKRCLNT